jgi:23S rRNA pseudouridine1911/1915/1917 synthase
VEIFASAADAGQRLDVVLAKLLNRSRSACAQLIKEGYVTVDGRPAKPSLLVASGAQLRVSGPPARESPLRASDLALPIVYDDPDFCVVDKPAGMATHPARGTPDGTVVNALLARFPSLPAINNVRRPGIVHRLDKDTSGLLVVAKSERAMTALSKAIAARRVKRVYTAVVWGTLPSERGVIDAPIGRDPRERTRFAIREDGRRARTHYQVVEKFSIARPAHTQAQTAALVRVELETGRTHQIRVHFAAIGNPVIGDATYGPVLPGVRMRRQALHAAELSFGHPVTAEKLRFTSPWPDDFRELVDRLRKGEAP